MKRRQELPKNWGTPLGALGVSTICRHRGFTEHERAGDHHLEENCVQIAANQTNILVVDDSEEIRDLLRDILEPAGFTVSTASDGQEGLRSLYANRPSLVIMDLTMPTMDGWQLLERIREVSGVPVIQQ